MVTRTPEEKTSPVATPVLAFLTKSEKVPLSILLTASHNPWQDGGYNFLTSEGAVASDKVTDPISEKLVKVTKEGSANIILTIIVTGDVNEDGILDITDLVKIRQQIQRLFEVDEKVTKFNGIQDKAGDINEDLLIDITDLVKIRRYIQKMENL